MLSNAPNASTAADSADWATQGQASPAPIPTRAISWTISRKRGYWRCPVSLDTEQGIRTPSLSRRRLHGALRKRHQKKNETVNARFRSNQGDAAYAVSPFFQRIIYKEPVSYRFGKGMLSPDILDWHLYMLWFFIWLMLYIVVWYLCYWNLWHPIGIHTLFRIVRSQSV